MISRLLYLGATHKTAALALREQLAVGPERIEQLQARLRLSADEAVVVSTCGRFEIYLVREPAEHPCWSRDLSDIIGLPSGVLRDHVEPLIGEAAANRALRVAAGLESRIVGEHHVLGQVRHAFESARLADATGPILSAVFRSAIHTGKRVRSETAIAHLARSYAGLAVDVVRSSMGSVDKKTIAIFGTGAMAREAASQLTVDPRCQLIILSGHADRAAEMARRYQCRGCAIEALPSVLADADAMICCASSRWGIVEHHVARRPRAKPLTMVDLGMPRNVDPSIASLPGIHLIDLDRLPGAAAPHRDSIAQAERIVGLELRRLVNWIREREVAPRIARLEQPVADRARRRELHREIVQLKEGAAA